MCEICGMRYCPAACPSYETAAIGVCAYCGEVIYDCEPHMIEAETGRVFHTECLESVPLPELLALFDVALEVGE